MSNEVSVVFTAEDAALWNAIQRQIAGSKKLGDSLEGAGKKGRESGAEMQRFAESVNRITTSPVERYNAQLTKLKTLLDADKISQDKYNLAVSHFKLELDKSSSAIDRNAAAVARNRTSQQSFGSSTENAAGIAGRAAGAVAGLAAGYLSLNTALNLANQYMDEHAARAERALELHTKLATAQEDSFKNLTGLGSAQKLDVHQEAVDIAKETGADPVVVEKAIADVYGVIGDIGKAQDAVRVSARESPLNDAQIPKAAVSRAMMGEASGVNDPKEVAGFHLSLQSTSVVADNAQLGKAVVPLLSSGRQMYPEQDAKVLSTQLGAMHSVLGKLGGDTEGMSTTTSAILITDALDRFFDKRPELKRKASTPLEQIQLIQQDTSGKLRAELLGKEGIGEGKFKAAIESMLTQGTTAAQLFAAFAKSIQFDAGLHKQAARETGLTPSQRMAVAKRKSDAASAARQMEEPELAQAEASRAITKQGLDDNRAPFMTIKGFGQWLNEKAIGAARVFQSDADKTLLDESQLRERQKAELRPALGLPSLGMLESAPTPEEFFDPRDQEKARKLTALMSKPITAERLQAAGVDAETQKRVLDLESRLDILAGIRRAPPEQSQRANQIPPPPPEVRAAAQNATGPTAAPQRPVQPSVPSVRTAKDYAELAEDLLGPEPTAPRPNVSPVSPAAAARQRLEGNLAAPIARRVPDQLPASDLPPEARAAAQKAAEPTALRPNVSPVSPAAAARQRLEANLTPSITNRVPDQIPRPNLSPEVRAAAQKAAEAIRTNQFPAAGPPAEQRASVYETDAPSARTVDRLPPGRLPKGIPSLPATFQRFAEPTAAPQREVPRLPLGTKIPPQIQNAELQPRVPRVRVGGEWPEGVAGPPGPATSPVGGSESTPSAPSGQSVSVTSPELEQAGREFLEAMREFRGIVAEFRQGATQIAALPGRVSRAPQVAASYPNYSGAARREQAVAAG